MWTDGGAGVGVERGGGEMGHKVVVKWATWDSLAHRVESSAAYSA